MSEIPRLEDLEGRLDGLSGRRILVRTDFNVPLDDSSGATVITDDFRIRSALPTIEWLTERGAQVVAASHLGRPKGEPNPKFSMDPVRARLAELAPGVELLENLRFHSGEKANDEDFARRLAEPFSQYVNDAFGTAHRSHASVVGAPELFTDGRKAAGLLMEREVAALSRMVENPEQPYVAVVGGAKVSTKTAPLEALVERVATLLIGGGMANTFLLAQGHDVGKSLVEPEMLDTALEVLKRAGERGVTVALPTDVVVTDSLENPQVVEIVAAHAVPSDLMIVDLGPESRQRYANSILGAKTVFWNGPMGVFEVEPFDAGTLAVARAMADSDAFTVVGGGESVMAIKRAGVADAIDHVSTGGGASLQFLTGEPLPALVALED